MTDLEVHGPGMWGKLSGISGEHILHFVIIVMLGMLMWQMQSIDKEREKQFSMVMTSLSENSAVDKTIINNQGKIIQLLDANSDSMDEMIYVSTLNERERKDLKLSMPKGLRMKMNGGK